MISYLMVEETANTLLANLMTALSSTDLSIMNDGYTALQQSQEEQIKAWIESVFTDKNFLCATYHYRPKTLWKVPQYKEKTMMILEKKRPDIAKQVEERRCHPSSKA